MLSPPARFLHRACFGFALAGGLAASLVQAGAPALTIDSSPVAEGAKGVASYADALAAARPAVVSVYSTKFARQRGQPGNALGDLRRFFSPGLDSGQPAEPERGLGSGVIVSPEGFVLTNNHVVDGADELLVQLPDGRELKAKIIGADPKTDIAVLRVEAGMLPAITLGDSDRLRVGDVVFALGNPLGVGQTATMGIVSATGRRSLDLLDRGDGEAGYEDFIQTDAAINVGNSGGALVDAKGRLIGINTAIISTSRGNIGIGFSIPVNLAAFVMRSLIENGTVVRGYLGVSTQNLDAAEAARRQLPEPAGVLVTGVTAGEPAEKAGLRPNDVILALNERAVTNRDELRLLVSQMKPGTKIALKVLHDGKSVVIEATLGLLPEAPAAAGELVSGIYVARINDQVRRDLALEEEVKGVAVVQVDRGSRFANRFAVGSVIEQVNRVDVTDLAAAKAALRRGRNSLAVRYGGLRQFISLELP